MEIFKKVGGTVAVLGLIFGLVGPTAVLAATTPSLGVVGTFGILSSSYTNTVAGTTITGDVGYTTGPAVVPTISGTTHVTNSTFNQAGTDQGSALSALNSQACTFTFAPGAIDLATDTTHGPIGVYTPGVYCTLGAASIGTAGISLSGAGTYIFRINGALTTVTNSAVTLPGGASSSDVFWTPTAATTLGANSTMRGTIIDASGITIGSTVLLTGRALAFGGTVTTDADTITVPLSGTPTPTPTSSATPTPSVTPTPTPTPSITPVPTLSPTPTPVPQLPATGVAPDNNGAPWNVIVPTGVFVALLSFYLVKRKQTV